MPPECFPWETSIIQRTLSGWPAMKDTSLLQGVKGAPDQGEPMPSTLLPCGCKPTVVGIYTRISLDDVKKDPTTGRQQVKGKGVQRQEEDCRALVSLRTCPHGTPWQVYRVYCDNDLSAFRYDVTRPDWEQMMSDLEAGVIQGVVVWKIDRFTRRPDELERAIRIYEKNPHYVFTALEMDFNLSTPSGRAIARVCAAFARLASEETGMRVARAKLQLAREGKSHGNRAMFGWREDGTADPATKKEILTAQKKILAGATVRDIQRDWVSRGIAPGGYPGAGKKFRGVGSTQHQTVKRALTSPALAGLVVYQGGIVYAEDGRPVEAQWERICSPEWLESVRARLEQRGKGKGKPPGTPSKHLLSSIAICGACGAPMGGATRRRGGRRDGEPYAVYICTGRGRENFKSGCIARVADRVDEHVINLVLQDQAAREEGEQSPPPAWSREGELEEVLASIATLNEHRQAGRLSVLRWAEAVEELDRQREGLQAEKRRLLAESRATLVVADSRVAFDALPLAGRREVIRRSVKAVIIQKQGRGIVKFDPSKIEIVWAD